MIKSGIKNARLLGPFYSRLSIFLSSFTKSLGFFKRDLVRKENITLNISKRDFRDSVENSLTLCFFCLVYLDTSLADILYMLLQAINVRRYKILYILEQYFTYY